VSFEEEEGDTYVFDLTFLTSAWTCIFGRGCPGVLDGPAAELEHGCCSYGAHFADKEDIRDTRKAIKRLKASQWQFKGKAKKLGGPIYVNDDKETVTRATRRVHLLNRPEFLGGAGCGCAPAAPEAGERPRLEARRVLAAAAAPRHPHRRPSTPRFTCEWKRRDWGDGGAEFHWWCTDDPLAFRDARPVYVQLRDDIVEMIGEEMYDRLAAYLDQRGTAVFLPHPALRKRTGPRPILA
jgi:hypothetical protein